MLDTNKIIKYPLNKGQYFEEEHPKKMIFLHHTAGNSSAKIVVSGWNDNLDKIGTAFVISGKPKSGDALYTDGEITQFFHEKFWAYHLGVKAEVFKKYNLPYQALDKISIAIEICSWGQLTKQPNGTFKNYVGGIVPNEEVVDLGKEFRGYRYYHSYSVAQINSLKDLLFNLCDKYKISKKFNEGMFDINQACLNGTNGIWSHTSVRTDKFDIFPQPSMIEMLKSLETK